MKKESKAIYELAERLCWSHQAKKWSALASAVAQEEKSTKGRKQK